MVETLAPPADESFADAMQRARNVLNFLGDLRIVPTPMRFTVVFAHHAGDIGDLSLAMNRLIAHDRLTGEALDELYQQFFGNEQDRVELNYASQKVQSTVVDVADHLVASRQRHDGYGVHLSEFVQALSDSDTGGLQDRSTALLEETQSVAEDQRLLEDRLNFTAREMEALRRHLDKLEHEARNDALTGIGNRSFFNQELRSAIAVAKRDSAPLCLLMTDVDHFKQFNDRYGHQMGDQVLKLVARQLDSIATGSGKAARYGGEEFALILPGSELPQAIEIADKLRTSVASKKVVNRRTGEMLGQVTLSIGVALYRPGEIAAELVHRADEAMYLAKGKGRNCVIADDHPDMKV